MKRRFSHDSTSFSLIPLDVEGALFVSPMPFGRYDREHVFRDFRAAELDRVVVLLSDEELKKRCSRNLKRLYERQGYEITQFPMVDFLQPGHTHMDELIPELVTALRQGERMAVHCHAGVGRSSVVVACICAVVGDMDLDTCIAFVKKNMETNITVEQKHFIAGWIERLHESRPGEPVLLRSAEVIATGTELLQGRTLNTHGHRIGEELTRYGIPLLRETVLPDDPQAIETAVAEAIGRSDLVIVTGGLGPTSDDLTLEACGKAINRRVVRSKHADEHMEAFFARLRRIPTQAQRDQACVLDGAEVHMNPAGIAPGQRIMLSRSRHLWLLPGPPRELDGLLHSALLPWLRDSTAREDRVQHVFRLLGQSESSVQAEVEALLPPPSVKPAYCARPGSVELRFNGPEKAVAEIADKVRLHYQRDLLNESGRTTEEELLDILRQQKQSVSVAESCTGGGLGQRITRLPGSSEVFRGGIIAYANEVKERELKVPSSVLAQHGAVSDNCARAMARGLRERFQTDWAISVTGIAGPGGGTPEKPVGLFFIGIAGPNGVDAFHYQANGNRAQIQEHATQRALEQLWRALSGKARA